MPAKMYAAVLADGTSEEFRTKKQAIARGEYSGQSFTVLSPRGYEVHIHTVPAPKTTVTDPSDTTGLKKARTIVRHCGICFLAGKSPEAVLIPPGTWFRELPVSWHPEVPHRRAHQECLPVH